MAFSSLAVSAELYSNKDFSEKLRSYSADPYLTSCAQVRIMEARYRNRILVLRANQLQVSSRIEHLKASEREKAEDLMTQSELELDRLMSVHRVAMEREANCGSSQLEATAGRPQLQQLQVEAAR